MLVNHIRARHRSIVGRIFETDGGGGPTMADDPREKPKTNGQDEDDDEREDKPWPDDNVPRPPFMPPPDQPHPDV